MVTTDVFLVLVNVKWRVSGEASLLLHEGLELQRKILAGGTRWKRIGYLNGVEIYENFGAETVRAEAGRVNANRLIGEGVRGFV